MSQPELEQRIFQFAETNSPEDFELLVKRLESAQLFLPADANSFPAAVKSGECYRVGPHDRVTARICQGPQQQPCVMVVTHDRHAWLAQGYLGLDWRGILEMCLKLGNGTGVLLQGTTSWVVFTHERIRWLLSRELKAD